MSAQAIREALQGIAASPASRLRAEVASIILDCAEDDVFGWLRDLFQHGCISGMVSSLVYYSDTHAFFDRHYEEIEFLRQLVEADLGARQFEGDLKNALAWFAFEETAGRLLDEFCENQGGAL